MNHQTEWKWLYENHWESGNFSLFVFINSTDGKQSLKKIMTHKFATTTYVPSSSPIQQIESLLKKIDLVYIVTY